jgi:hypothetical protein
MWCRRSWFSLNGKVGVRGSEAGRSSYAGPGPGTTGRIRATTPHWHEHIGNPTIADAVLDRLVHSAHRLELKGESLRKLQAVRNAKLDEAAGS